MKTDKQFYDDINQAREVRKIDLTEWEDNFVDSIGMQLIRGSDLSKKQRETLDRIHERIRLW